IVPRSDTASTASALGMPLLISVVPSIGSTATSHSGPSPLPTSSPLYSIGASSFSPSPITTTPRIDTEPTNLRMASTAAPSPPFLSPRPTQRPAAIAAASVTRTSSIARLRSGSSCFRSSRGFDKVLISPPGTARQRHLNCRRKIVKHHNPARSLLRERLRAGLLLLTSGDHRIDPFPGAGEVPLADRGELLAALPE